MKKKEVKKTSPGLVCQKCHESIGGKAYHMIQLDCIYDGNTLSACDRMVLCSDCYGDLRSWLKLL
jgi:hypothetical protein